MRLLPALLIALHPLVAGTVYYVDCASGSDAATGLSQTAAWRTTQRAARQDYRAGDSILFRRRTACAGMFAPRGSGIAAAPIHLGAWGTGALPRIAASAGEDAAFRLINQEHWEVSNIEFSGGDPHGVFVSGTAGVLHGIHIRDIVIHDVAGEPKNKEGGLLVIAPGSANQRFDDVLIDGVTAYRTSQWAGILVGGVAFGFLPETARSTNVVVRNSIVHDVGGDGIILFQVNHGTIDSSVAWNTGMQKKETIGTPDGIWTWMCRDCAVSRSEAFLTHSPGIDGGAFDIDYGNDNGVVADSYGHDTQGYCVAVFGAGWVTRNSIVRNNVCVNNGRRPDLARRQGAIFLTTWDKGKLDGVIIEGNRIDWTPPVDAPALVNNAEFIGPAFFRDNAIRSAVPSAVASNASLKIGGGTWDFRGEAKSIWQYGGKTYTSLAAFQKGSGQDAGGREVSWHDGDPVDGALLPAISLPALQAHAGQWLLVGFADADEAGGGPARGMVALMESAEAQFRSLGLRAAVVAGNEMARGDAENLAADWHLGAIPLLADRSLAHKCGLAGLPAIILVNREQRIVWRHEGRLAPGDLGLVLRHNLGEPDYARMEQRQ